MSLLRPRTALAAGEAMMSGGRWFVDWYVASILAELMRVGKVKPSPKT